MNQIPALEEVIKRDPRFAYEAYEFVFAALEYTQKMLDRAPRADEDDDTNHVSGPELLAGICEFSKREFGLMARTVFRHWGINRTGDFGDIVFNLIEAKLMKKTPRDNRADFEDVFDLDKILVQGYRITARDTE